MIRVPGDKSISHRALLLAALAEGESRLSGLLPGEDCRSTAACLRALGAEVPDLPPDGGEIRVRGRGAGSLRSPAGALDCGNSGTSARLLLGVLAGLPVEATLTGDGSLRGRPMARVTDPLAAMGARFSFEADPGRLPVRVRGGGLRPGRHRSPVASAQVKSAILLAGVTGGVEVAVEEPVRSRDHTERMLRRAGLEVEEGAAVGGGWRVSLAGPRGPLQPLRFEVPGDFSSAAFLLALGLLGGAGGELRIGRVGVNPTRTGLLDVLRRMGADVTLDREREAGDAAGEPVADLVARPSELRGVEVGGEEIPALIDEIPVLAVLASRARGSTRIRDARELRVKESDRIAALARNLEALGVEVEERPDGLLIEGSGKPLRGTVRAFGDHRIAMAFGVLGALPGQDVRVEGAGTVDVSFPGFWELLGGLAAGTGGEAAGGGASMGGGGTVPVVTIDGPAGSGKSTTARSVARALGFRHLDSGALYRAVTLALLRSGRPEGAWKEVTEEELGAFGIGLVAEAEGFRVVLAGSDPGEALRSPEVTSRVSAVARVPAVRTWLLGAQRSALGRGGVVADGRDMGTIVFPDAALKVFLVAELEERARRRLLQEGGEADPEAVTGEAERLGRRDRADADRALAPLVRPPGAVEVDTTALTFDEQVGRIVALAREKLAPVAPGGG